MFTWRHYDGSHWRIQERRLSSSGTLGPIQTLSAAGQDAFGPQVAVNGKGKAAFAWRRYDGHHMRIQGRTRSTSGSLGPVETLSSASQNAFSPDVAIGPQGGAVFAWSRFVPTSNACCEKIEDRGLSADGRLGAVQTVSPPPGPQNFYNPEIHLDAQAKALIAWRVEDDTSDMYNVLGGVEVRSRSATGTLGPVQSVQDGYYVYGKDFAMNSKGYAVFGWSEAAGHADPPPFAWARARTPAGKLRSYHVVSYKTGGDSADDAPVVGVDDSGKAVLIFHRWAEWDTQSGGIGAITLSSTDHLGPLQTLSATGSNPVVAENGAGNAAAGWIETQGNDVVIKASTGP
jgi:hypothetical protein